MRKTGMFRALFATLLLTLCLLALPARAAQYKDGRAAYDRKDFKEAARIWRELADKGDVDAELALGTLYGYGLGVKEDYTQSFHWFSKAAEQKSSRGQFAVCEQYGMGFGVKEDYTKAMKWCRMAADQGLGDAQLLVGQLYFTGKGVKRDWPTALQWIRKAADQGNGRAQFLLGYLYQKGYAVKKSDADAYFWYSLGLKSSASHMTMEEKDAMNKRIKDWKPAPTSTTLDWEQKKLVPPVDTKESASTK